MRLVVIRLLSVLLFFRRFREEEKERRLAVLMGLLDAMGSEVGGLRTARPT